ncbi:DUF2163 domain-containing protein [Mesorhizobium sp. B1-1-2]|uniref:baseplate hub domain-containing protein n=1 Tax=Mesorhizobium sp. B1-1-2 TaxID=2589982 RepID=UPI00112DD8D5|nr:DUF2163 domain-containing protein [Mesorhizobium sp. B1-1-2]TPN79960.1 DUF2163 domain-containing protein [Mesorhizobium sp. B1-1-2]
MLSLPDGVAELLDQGNIVVRGLIKFELGGGTYGFIKSLAPLTWSGVTYQPGGIIQVSDLSAGTGTAARQFTITLAASPDDGLTPEVLRTIEAEDYRDRPVTIYDAYFHPDTGALLGVRALRRGYIDTIPHNEDETGYTLTANCETRALDYTRTNGRKRSHRDQQRRSPGDKFLEHASTRGRVEVFWGRTKKA